MDEALSSDRPFVYEAFTDPDVPPLPPHITLEEAKGYAFSIARSVKMKIGQFPDQDLTRVKAARDAIGANVELSHYYEGRIRPRSAYAFGLIYWWSRVATWMPRIVNFFTQTPIMSSIIKTITGMAPERQFPVYAKENFKEQFNKRKNKLSSSLKVILWPDTFSNYFHPEIAMADC